MSKASGTRAPPTVEDKVGSDPTKIYDFIQSEEWQQVLEIARKERERNLASRDKVHAEKPAPKPNKKLSDHSTPSKNRTRQKHFREKVVEARQQREQILAHRSAEQQGTGQTRPKSAGDVGPKVRSNAVANAPVTARRATKNQAELDQDKHPKPEPHKDKTAKTNKGDEFASPFDNGLTGGEDANRDLPEHVAANGSANLTEHSNSDALTFGSLKRKRSVTGWIGSVALGCTIGVVASSFVFAVLSWWKPMESPEQTSSISPSAERIAPTAQASGTNVQLETVTKEVSTDAPPLTFVAPAPIKVPLVPVLSKPIYGAFEDTPIVTMAMLPLPEVFMDSVPITPVLPAPTTPVLLSVAPNVLTNPVALEAPRADIEGKLAVAAISSVVRDAKPQGGQGPVSVLSGGNATLVHLADVPVVTIAPSNPPEFSIQPVALTYGEERQPLTTKALTHRPEPDGSVATPTRPNSVALVELAALGFFEPPQAPNPAEQKGTDLTTVSTSPTIETEDIVPFTEGIAPRQLQPGAELPDATDIATAPATDSEPVGSATSTEGASFVLFAPSNLTADTVNSVLINLASSGHELSTSNSVNFSITQTNVRFYHPQDAQQAAALAEDAGALLRDFTDSKSKTPSGVIELWLAGKSAGKPKVKKARRKAPQENQVTQLKRQVLSKLKTATNQ
ncbi:hypothetical protein [Ruegeria sp.]|uniref:hypothetical protein n=1 Tax=Ruegeria sp. TaxID=1879320 RepID=UPI003B5939B7